LLALVGLGLLPVIYWSINCPDPNQCSALHQRSSLKNVEANILLAMLVLSVGFWMYSFMTAFQRVRNIILEREMTATWVQELKEAA
jgi:heme exporter protein C